MLNPATLASRVGRSIGSALPTACIALVALAAGEVAAQAHPTVAFWPLGAVMLGWLARRVGRGDQAALANAHERAGPPVDRLGALLAGLFVGVVCTLLHGPEVAGVTVVAGVLLPLVISLSLAWISRWIPPRGIGSPEIRLLAAALGCVPIAAALRSEGSLTWLMAAGAGQPFLHLVLGDLMAAVIFAPLMFSIGGELGSRAHPLSRRSSERAAVPRGSLLAELSSKTVWGAAAAIVGCLALGLVMDVYGRPDVVGLVAVLHLTAGLWIARSIPGWAGLVLLAVNAASVAWLQAGWFDPAGAVGGIDNLSGAATLMLLAGVLALQFLLRALSEDARENARTLIRQALRSDLSGLPNHRALARIVQATLARSDRATFWMVGVVLPDIARWSDLTDSRAAAELERAVGGRLRSTFEPMGGRVAHPSSGRFVITLGHRFDGIAIRQGLHRTLGGRSFDISDQSIQLRYLAGMVEVPADAAVDAEAVLAALSMALQRAAGDPTGIFRSTVSAQLLDGYRTELQMVELVSRALNEGRVRLFAERMEVARNADTGWLHYEVLARVVDDQGALLEPRQFLPAIWHAGLSGKLDRLMFVRTIAHLAAHPALLQATRLCSINVAGPTLCDPEFPDFVQRSLATHRVDPGRLMLEITESSTIADLELARAHVLRLSGMGLLIALDDFGTGLATFDYLKRLPADFLKIDGAFIRNLTTDGVDREIVRAIVRISQATGTRTVAEWIETPEQRATAIELGVDLLQGRLIAHPVPIEQLRIQPAHEHAGGAGAGDTVPVRYEHGAYAQRASRRAAARQTATEL